MGGPHLPAVSLVVIQAAFSHDSGFRDSAGNSDAFTVVVAAESQYVVGRILCLSAQQTDFSTNRLSDDVGGAAT